MNKLSMVSSFHTSTARVFVLFQELTLMHYTCSLNDTARFLYLRVFLD